MNNHDILNLANRNSRKLIAALSLVVATFAISTPESTADTAVTTPSTADAEFIYELNELCNRIYFDSDGSQCNPLTTSETTPSSITEMQELTEGMQELGARLKFDQ